jgi:hypothetical protein
MVFTHDVYMYMYSIAFPFSFNAFKSQIPLSLSYFFFHGCVSGWALALTHLLTAMNERVVKTTLSHHRLLIVLVRCNEPLGHVTQQLRAAALPYLIYQKVAGICNSRPLPPAEAAHARMIPFNLGRECIGYLQFMSEQYNSLPRMTAFLQWGAEMHMPLRGHGLPSNLLFLLNRCAHGLAAHPCKSAA